MKSLRVLVLAVTVFALLATFARPAAAASDNSSRNILIGVLIGAGVGAIVGLVVYLAKDKPPQPATTARNPPSWSAIGLGPLPLSEEAVGARGETASTRGALLRF